MPYKTASLDELVEAWEGLKEKKLSGKYVVAF